MGIFSTLFKKQTSTQPSANVCTSGESHIVHEDPEIPPLQGDYAKTIFLWAHEKASPVKNNDGYCRYFLYECGIRDPSQYHRELIEAGYFEEASIEQSLNLLKVTELKEILSGLGESTTGKKDTLVWRIANNTDTAQISQYFPEKLYVLSDVGQAFLLKHNDYVLIHKHKNWGVDWKEYDAHRVPGRNYYDTMLAIFKEQLAKGPQDFGRSQYFFMYQLFNEEGKRECALQMLLRVLYIDLSGVELLRYHDLYRDGIYTQKELYECFDVVIMLAPGILNPIKDFADLYRDEIVDTWRTLPSAGAGLPF